MSKDCNDRGTKARAYLFVPQALIALVLALYAWLSFDGTCGVMGDVYAVHPVPCSFKEKYPSWGPYYIGNFLWFYAWVSLIWIPSYVAVNTDI
ncbi:MAG: hypothetical protein KDD62_13750, partial [Bdellovibrionales bacterium]|nr:hypothetical protein [Bdellovibrionales bacterium]